jgi:DNA-binding NarL/FixJ family response regulator
LQLGTQAQDSLIVAGARLGLGTYYQAVGKTDRALEEVTAAYEYYNEHSMEEPLALKDSLAIMNAAHEKLYRNARTMAIGACLLLILAALAGIVLVRLRKTKKDLTATAELLDETIEELRPEEGTTTQQSVHLAKREKEVARLIMDGKTTKEIASEMGVNEQTVCIPPSSSPLRCRSWGWISKRPSIRLSPAPFASVGDILCVGGTMPEPGRNAPRHTVGRALKLRTFSDELRDAVDVQLRDGRLAFVRKEEFHVFQ